jgi:DNA-damage-inducible protein J
LTALRALSYNVAQSDRQVEMAKNSVVRARIDERIKEEATTVLAAVGLTVSDAFRLLLVRVAQEKALPFEPLVPNRKTISALRAARRGSVKRVVSPKSLLAELNAED